MQFFVLLLLLFRLDLAFCECCNIGKCLELKLHSSLLNYVNGWLLSMLAAVCIAQWNFYKGIGKQTKNNSKKYMANTRIALLENLQTRNKKIEEESHRLYRTYVQIVIINMLLFVYWLLCIYIHWDFFHLPQFCCCCCERNRQFRYKYQCASLWPCITKIFTYSRNRNFCKLSIEQKKIKKKRRNNTINNEKKPYNYTYKNIFHFNFIVFLLRWTGCIKISMCKIFFFLFFNLFDVFMIFG